MLCATYNGVMVGNFQSWLYRPSAAGCDRCLEPRRIEFHLLSVGEYSWYLVCLAGTLSIDRIHRQGPLSSRDLALGQLKKITEALLAQGYERVDDQQWQLPAWRQRKLLMEARSPHRVDCVFREDQVWPWPGK